MTKIEDRLFFYIPDRVIITKIIIIIIIIIINQKSAQDQALTH